MQEFIEYLKSQAACLNAKAELNKLRLESATLRLGNSVKRWHVNHRFSSLREQVPDILDGTMLYDLGAIHFICIPPDGSGIAARRYTSRFSSISRPGLSLKELERVNTEDEDFQLYLEALPAGSQVTMTFTDQQNRILGTRTGIK